MNDQAFILCVDDEPINVTIMEEILAENYQMESVTSGEACLQAIDRRLPDLVLLDVNMPNMDGLETCISLRNNPQTEDIPVIFVSALATEAELMAGYQAGGDDYITKPFSEEILQRKIKVVLDAEAKKKQLREMTDTAVQALMQNQDSINELDLVLTFLQECFKQVEFDGLSKVIFKCLANFDLDASLLILNRDEALCWFSDDIDRPMERQILLSLNSQDRLVRFGARLAINSSRATILVRNMPDDAGMQARLTDHLNIIIEGLEAKLKSMELETTLGGQKRRMRDAARRTLSKLSDSKTLDKKHHNKSEQLLTKFASDTSEIVSSPEITAAQRKAIEQVANRLQNRSRKLNLQREELTGSLEELLSDIFKELQKD